MERKTGFLSIFLVLVSFAALTACGSGSGGTGPTGTTTPVGVFVKTVALPLGGGSWTDLLYPHSGETARYQALVRARDLNGSGLIHALSLRFGADSAGNTCPNVMIRMGHTSKTDLVTMFASNVNRNPNKDPTAPSEHGISFKGM